MKRIITLIAVIITLPGAFAFADQFATLAGYRDYIEVPAGQVALLLTSADAPTVQYQKKGKHPVQFRLGDSSCDFSYTRKSGRKRNRLTPGQPLALVGPSKISLVTDGVVSIRIVTLKGGK